MLKQATEKDPENAIAWNKVAFVISKQWESAIQDLRAVVARTPNATDVDRGLAEAYCETNKPELATLHESMAQ